ncbi:MAG: nucleotidyl transferase AbiEii/AbiGii toxin family protein [Bacteroidota bacterium]|nr:nucleotidyl transferase AbiEii/AbiGii toxin family protein [Bacteroidota bacterium]
MSYQYEQFETALKLLDGRLFIAGAPDFNLVVCGGTALIATELIQRTTRDVDIVAMADSKGKLVDPAPLPEALITAAQEVAEDLNLPKDWLNNGPSSGEGGIYRLGLPQGFSDRLKWRIFGEKLTVAFIDRIDQIYFKLYAAVDQFGSYHATDLQALEPTDDELLGAVAWSRTHDPSEGYLECIKMFFKEFGYEHLVERI